MGNTFVACWRILSFSVVAAVFNSRRPEAQLPLPRIVLTHLAGKRRLESDVPPTCAHAPNASDGLMAITGVDMADAVLVSSPVDMVTME